MDGIGPSARRLALAFLQDRDGADEAREWYAGDDLRDIPPGCAVEVVVRIVRPDVVVLDDEHVLSVAL